MQRNRYTLPLQIIAILSVWVGLLDIVGWFFDLEVFRAVVKGFTTMKFNTAACLLFLGAAILFNSKEKPIYTFFYIIFSSFVVLIGMCTLLQYATGTNFGIDEYFVLDQITRLELGMYPGRMSLSTATCMTLMGASFIALKSQKIVFKRIAQYSLHVVTLISFIAIIGYLYNLPNTTSFSFLISMAMHTAVLLFLLSVGASFYNPKIGITAVFTGERIGNVMARRLLLQSTVFIISLGYIRLLLHRLSLVSVEFGILFFVVSSFLTVTLFIIYNTSRYLNRIDAKRDKVEQSLIQAKATLEDKVKARTEELEKTEEKFFKAFHMSPTGLVLSDVITGKFIEVNDGFCEMMGYSKSELIDKNILELGIISAEDREKTIQLVMQQVSGLKNHEITFYTKQREARTGLTSVELIDVDGQKCVLSTYYDITDRKETEKKLKKARTKAEEATRSQEYFLTNMSHEIRTPLNAITGFTSLIEKESLSPQNQQYLQHIETSTENLLAIVDDIVDYSKIENGMMALEEIPFKLIDLLKSIQSMFLAKAKEKQLDLTCSIDPSMPASVLGDPTKFTQIIVNLLDNALKFTEKGCVSIHLQVTELKKESVRFAITIQDTGVGIAEEQQAKIFDRFVQGSSSTARYFGGSGLGLTIAKSLVTLQKGDLTVASKLKEGSTFTITLQYPIQVASAPVKSTMTSRLDALGKFEREVQVLLVEDNLLNQLLAKEVLGRFGCKTEIAENGKIGFELIQKNTYDIVLMDIQMPIMDGYTASKKVRAEISSNLPIVAMTAHVMSGEKEKCISFGMTDYIAKPFVLEELHGVIKKYAFQEAAN